MIKNKNASKNKILLLYDKIISLKMIDKQMKLI